MATPKDSKADFKNGTLVREVDSQGKAVKNGVLSKLFGEEKGLSEVTTARWSTHPATDPDKYAPENPCPIWIKSVVVGRDFEAAKAGFALAGESDGEESSSSSSQRVNVIAVDGAGKQIGSEEVRFTLVKGISPEIAADGMAIATELWLSMEPIDTSDPEIAKMANRCKQELGGGGGGNRQS